MLSFSIKCAMKAIVMVCNMYLDFLKIKADKVTFTKNDYLAEKSVDLESESDFPPIFYAESLISSRKRNSA